MSEWFTKCALTHDSRIKRVQRGCNSCEQILSCTLQVEFTQQLSYETILYEKQPNQRWPHQLLSETALFYSDKNIKYFFSNEQYIYSLMSWSNHTFILKRYCLWLRILHKISSDSYETKLLKWIWIKIPYLAHFI